MNELGKLRATMRGHDENETVDVVVVGTGAGGAPLLAKLAAAGLKVVALEAGPWWESPSEEFATDETDAAKLYWLEDRLHAGDGPMAFGGNNSGTGVGGSMLHWGAFVPRAEARDLRLASEFAEGVDWPLEASELTPFLRGAGAVSGREWASSYPWDATRRYPLPPVAVNAPGQLMQRGFAALGLRTSEAPIAAVSQAYGQPGVCAARGLRQPWVLPSGLPQRREGKHGCDVPAVGRADGCGDTATQFCAWVRARCGGARDGGAVSR